MQMIRHQTELQDADGWIVAAHDIQLVNNGVSQRRAFNPCLRRVVLRYH